MEAWFSYRQLLVLLNMGNPIPVYWQNGKEIIVTQVGSDGVGPYFNDVEYIGHVDAWRRSATNEEISRLVLARLD